MKVDDSEVDIVDVYEQMLFQRAAKGIRPTLYVSSVVDLECSMLMLLDEEDQQCASGRQRPIPQGVGYHIVTN
ncbi:MAG TPA: hypothetical protein VJ464_27035 [Blastocatellia bacterium]|nr:hypothetical protein [Blastocatellia bacterium]